MCKKNHLSIRFLCVFSFLFAGLQLLDASIIQASETVSTVQDTLTNGNQGPKLVLVPKGRFLMGSPQQEPGRYADEGPQHEVIFANSFFLGMTEITVGQFRTFIDASGYQTDAELNGGSYFRDPAFGFWQLSERINWRVDHAGKSSEDNNPVVHVSWNDAKAYVEWLSEQTGKHYRLPSEAEIEYANRAGSTDLYWWGNGSPKPMTANIKGDQDFQVANPATWEHTPGEQAYAFREGLTPHLFQNYGDKYHGLAPVGITLPNPFGLYDTTGNVWEWTEDCWHPNYVGAPVKGNAWIDDNCHERVIKGGSFYCYPRHMRSANRWRRLPDFRNMYVGFRIARDP